MSNKFGLSCAITERGERTDGDRTYNAIYSLITLRASEAAAQCIVIGPVCLCVVVGLLLE